MTSLEAEAASGARWTGSTAAVLAAIRLAQTAVLARLLPQSDFGLMSMALVVVGLGVLLADAGTGLALIQRQDLRRAHLSTLFWFNLLLGAAIFAAIQVATPLAVLFYGDAALREVLFSLSFVVLLSPLGQVHEALLRRGLHFRRLAGAEMASGAAGVAVAVAAGFAGQGAQSLVLGQVANAATRSALLVCAGGQAGWRPALHFRAAELRGYLRFGMFQTGSRLVAYCAMNVDKLLIGRLLGAEALGFYAIAWSLVMNPIAILSPVIIKVTFPLLSRIQGDAQRLRRGYLKIVETISFATLPIYLGLFATAEPLIALYLGPGWQPSVGILRVLVFLGILYAWGNPMGLLMLAMGRPGLGFGVTLFNTTVYFAAVLLGAPWGLRGVAVGLVLASWLISWPAEYGLRWVLLRMSPREYLARVLPPLAYSALMAALVMAVDSAVALPSQALRLSLLVVTGAAAYAGLVYGLDAVYLRRTLRLFAGRG